MLADEILKTLEGMCEPGEVEKRKPPEGIDLLAELADHGPIAVSLATGKRRLTKPDVDAFVTTLADLPDTRRAFLQAPSGWDDDAALAASSNDVTLLDAVERGAEWGRRVPYLDRQTFLPPSPPRKREPTDATWRKVHAAVNSSGELLDANRKLLARFGWLHWLLPCDFDEGGHGTWRFGAAFLQVPGVTAIPIAGVELMYGWRWRPLEGKSRGEALGALISDWIWS